ncbi:MAG: hypothetical protein IMZ55_11880 [Acidobacteria bacterium]|nr:hypothetical protein [Acidobacteriota bacterium]
MHRINTGGGEGVYAIVTELERWQASAAGTHAARDTGEADDPPGDAQPADAPHAGDKDLTAAPSRPQRRKWSWLAVGAVAAPAIVAGLAYWWLAGPAAAGQPAQWRIEGSKLVISDSAGRFLWNYAFESPLAEVANSTARALGENHRPVVFHDIDDDGRMEVLFVHDPWWRSSRGLYCFGHDGSLLFHREPGHVVRFGEKTYGPPWRGAFVYVTGPAGRTHDIWFVSSHLEEFPTVLEKLDAAGNVKGEYWSNGQVYSLTVGEVAGRPLMFVGGINNEFKGGSLTILDARQAFGAAPAASDHYRCRGCPPSAPVAFLVFPRLDVTAALDSFSTVTNVFVDKLGQALVDVVHDVGTQVPLELQVSATSHYTLDSQFRVVTAELGRHLTRIHGEFERKGLLNHPFDPEYDARFLWPVLRWDGSRFQEIAGLEAGGPR